ncbi:hypothetical protein Fmac_005802 [Flemingia macrophylla]|uniref:Uncharacterized protein n=1 Tax=Flemingia macrophylla TaxID=520843 RepID=A0ABD1N8T5_9FABA
MALHRINGELFSERRGIVDGVFNSFGKIDHGSRISRRGRRFGRITKLKLSRWIFLLTAILSILLTFFGLKMFYQAKMESKFSMIPHNLQEERNLLENIEASNVAKTLKGKRRKLFLHRSYLELQTRNWTFSVSLER